MNNYSDKLRDPRWQKKRLEIFNRDKWICRKCGDEKETLNVHHLKYNGNPWEAKDEDLITLCTHCHKIIEFLDDKFENITINYFRFPDGTKDIYIHEKLIFKEYIHLVTYKGDEVKGMTIIPINILDTLKNMVNE